MKQVCTQTAIVEKCQQNMSASIARNPKDWNDTVVTRYHIMTWSNDEQHSNNNIIVTADDSKANDTLTRTIACPSCGHSVKLQEQSGGVQDLPGLPAGVKFDPSDQEILQHLEAKVVCDRSWNLHPLIDEFIPTIEGEDGICYTHPEKLPGLSKEGQIRHFFHRPSKAYTTGTRKRRKVHTDAEGGETRWHKTGKTRPVSTGNIKGYKKILVLYTNYGRQRKPEKTNWVMHQYHLGDNEEEKDGELVVSKVFYQTQPRQCGSSSAANKEAVLIHKTNDGIAGEGVLMKNASFVYYNNPAPFVSYGQNVDRECPHPMIPNLVVHGDESSLIHLPSSASKGK